MVKSRRMWWDEMACSGCYPLNINMAALRRSEDPLINSRKCCQLPPVCGDANPTENVTLTIFFYISNFGYKWGFMQSFTTEDSQYNWV